MLRLAPFAPGPVRLAMARRAAARGLTGPALTAAPDDPVVLARLGMLARAARALGGGREGAVARATASAALGDISSARAMADAAAPLSAVERRALAAAAAPFEPSLALHLLSDADPVDKAACALAAGQLDLAQSLLAQSAPVGQAQYLRGAIAAWRSDWRSARAALNLAFEGDGLAGPLSPDSDEPTRLETFGAVTLARITGAPLVSLVVAAHNAEPTLPLAVGSLTSQTWRNLEIIIVDDRSTDGTAAVARELALRDNRVRLLANARGPGAYGARNTGVAAAHGEFIGLHDADDWAHPQRIARQMATLGTKRALTICRYFRLDAHGRPMCPRVFPLVRLSPIALVARAEAWSATGPFEEVGVGADSEWLARFDRRWGRGAGLRTQEVGMVAAWGSGSLSSAPETGLSGEGLRRRVAYVEAWRLRHAGLA